MTLGRCGAGCAGRLTGILYTVGASCRPNLRIAVRTALVLVMANTAEVGLYCCDGSSLSKGIFVRKIAVRASATYTLIVPCLSSETTTRLSFLKISRMACKPERASPGD